MLRKLSGHSFRTPVSRIVASTLHTYAAGGPCRRMVRSASASPWTNESGCLLRVCEVAPQLQQLRCYDSCKPKKESACGPPNIKQECGEQPKKPKEVKKKKAKSKSMWQIDGCEVKELCVLPVRYDVKYYRISDKLKRKYQVTWNECPRLLIKPKKVCIYDKLTMPKIPRRKRPYSPKTACAMPPNDSCSVKPNSKCPRATMPCCKDARIPPNCLTERGPSDCKKRKAPYPSFSECKKDELTKGPSIECFCLDLPALCDAWAELRKRIASGRGEFKCGKL